MIDESFIIGITGNIATGKSVLRRMLENSGAFTIDADQIAHRILYPGGLAYQSVIDGFGSEILNDDGSISNKLLGQIVFNNPALLTLLESLTHPAVLSDIDNRVSSSKNPIVAIEAIKLLESGLRSYCDALWVSHTTPAQQIDRLLTIRGLTAEEAQSRINAQPLQSAKIRVADVVISTESTFKDTWEQIQNALSDTIISRKLKNKHINNLDGFSLVPVSSLDEAHLESFWVKFTSDSIDSLYQQLGLSKIIALRDEEQIVALVITEEWNFTSKLQKVVPTSFWEEHPGVILNVLEHQAVRHQTELLLIPEEYAFGFTEPLLTKGYSKREVNQLNYPAWQSAAQRASPGNAPIWVNVITQPFEVVNAQYL